jgi:hypothetical protein
LPQPTPTTTITAPASTCSPGCAWPGVVSPFVVAETTYMLGRFAGSAAEAAFVRSLRAGDLVLAEILPGDLDRMAEILDETPTCISARPMRR